MLRDRTRQFPKPQSIHQPPGMRTYNVHVQCFTGASVWCTCMETPTCMLKRSLFSALALTARLLNHHSVQCVDGPAAFTLYNTHAKFGRLALLLQTGRTEEADTNLGREHSWSGNCVTNKPKPTKSHSVGEYTCSSYPLP